MNERRVTLKTRCLQCGKQYRALACGFSHALIRDGLEIGPDGRVRKRKAKGAP